MILLLALVLPFLGALGVLSLRFLRCPQWGASLSLAVAGLDLLLIGLLNLRWAREGTLAYQLEWLPNLGLDFSLWLDGPALFYSWLIVGIGFLVLQYSPHYMKPKDSPLRFYAAILAFLGSMLGIVLSRNLVLMFLFWEMTSLTSFLLIGHWSHKKEAVLGAQRALLITGCGGLALLAGIALLGVALKQIDPTMPLEWDSLWNLAPQVIVHPLAPAVLVLMLLGAFTKSAQFPFHFWLPGAMQAPTPVSALLHAATMVKAGIFLIGRLYPIFNTELLWVVLVASTGVVTMFWGGFQALFCRDLKQLLAFSTVSQLGLLVAYYGLGYRGAGGQELLKTDLLLVASHALFKGGLFLLCGIVDHETGTRDRTRLGGLWKKMPATALLSMLACLSMAGMPFTLGFVAKKLFLEEGLRLETPILYLEEALFLLALVGSSFTVAYCLKFAVDPFLGKPREEALYKKAHEGPWPMLLAPVLLVGLCVAGGLYVPVIENPLSYLVLSEVIESDTHYTVALFHKADLLFWISLAIYFIGGPICYFLSGRFETLFGGWEPGSLQKLSDRVFLEWLPALAARITGWAHSPSRQRNLSVVLAFLLAAAGIPLMGGKPGITLPRTLAAEEWVAVGNLVAILVLTGIVLLARPMLLRVLALGFIGMSIAFYFVIVHAPDLAITQVLVELVLLLMFLHLLGHFRGKGKPLRARHTFLSTALALGIGGLMTVLTHTAATSPWREVPVLEGKPTVSDYYLANAKYPAEQGGHSGGGRNVVNVILVDFRAMDTLGEISVLVIAALGVAVLGRRVSRRQSHRHRPGEYPETPHPQPMVGLIRDRSVALHGSAPLVSILTFSLAAVLFFAGHNHPGGGFIAGLAACIAAVPLSLRPRSALSEYQLFSRNLVLPSVGLFLAIATGAAAVLAGFPFLRSAHVYATLFPLGTLELASAMVFDLGVFLTVLGIAAIILKTLVKA
jgi:multicomponent K+:H+ antiporter subunit A